MITLQLQEGRQLDRRSDFVFQNQSPSGSSATKYKKNESKQSSRGKFYLAVFSPSSWNVPIAFMAEQDTLNSISPIVISDNDEFSFDTIHTINDLALSSFKLLKPIDIHLDLSGEQIIAWCPLCEEFAVGKDRDEAVQNIKSAILDLYVMFENEQDKLGPLPLDHWNALKNVIRKV
jgi:predicted RNase H-like HicB family nuclease